MQDSRTTIVKRGIELLIEPALNRSTGFTEAEQKALGLLGLVPDTTESIETQLSRVVEQLKHRLARPLSQQGVVLQRRYSGHRRRNAGGLDQRAEDYRGRAHCAADTLLAHEAKRVEQFEAHLVRRRRCLLGKSNREYPSHSWPHEPLFRQPSGEKCRCAPTWLPSSCRPWRRTTRACPMACPSASRGGKKRSARWSAKD
jgi:hypothetical protein